MAADCGGLQAQRQTPAPRAPALEDRPVDAKLWVRDYALWTAAIGSIIGPSTRSSAMVWLQ